MFTSAGQRNKRPADLLAFAVCFGLMASLAMPAAAGNDGAKTRGVHRPWLGPATVAEIIIDTTGLDTLERALESNGLVELFAGREPYTVFAPTNRAFAALGLMTDSDLSDLAEVLAYHVVPGRQTLRDVVTAGSLPTLLGEATLTGVADTGAFIIGSGNETPAAIVVEGIYASNGVVYVIDKVLLPPAQ